MKVLTVMAGIIASAWTHYGNANVTEVLWTLSGLVGIYFTWHNLQDARRYIIAIRPLRKVERDIKIIAFGHYRNEIMRLLVFLIVIGIGVVAMLTPPLGQSNHTNATGLAITLGLFMVTAILIAASALDRRQRDLLLEEID